MNYRTAQLIGNSVLYDTVSIVHVVNKTIDFFVLVNDLWFESDDCVRITEEDSRIEGNVIEVREYWGNNWRVHVHIYS